MKKTLLLLTTLFTFTFVSAQFTLDDITYTVTTGTDVAVTGSTLAVLNIPATVLDGGITYNVVAVGASAFENNTTITSVVLPTSVVTLETKAFKKATNLASINLENVTTISDKDVFSTCTSLTTVDISSLSFLGKYAFYSCHGLESITLPATVTNIREGAFLKMNGLRTINIPNTVTTIGHLFLGQCAALSHVQVNWAAPGDVNASGKYFFRDLLIATDGTITLYVPAGTKADYVGAEPWGQIADPTPTGPNAFHANNIVEGTLADIVPAPTVGDVFSVGDYDYRLTSLSPNEVEVSGTSNAALTSVVIPASATNSADAEVYAVTSIGANAFENNGVITSVSLASSVTLVKTKAFKNMVNLTTINLDNIVTISEKDVFSTCTSLTTIGALTNATYIGNYAFYKCGALTNIEIPAAVTIGSGVFRQSGIIKMNIPSSVTSLGDQLFREAASLTHVQLNWADPATGVFSDDTNTFGSLTVEGITLYVPETKKSLYEGHATWTLIPDANIIEGDLSLGTGNLEQELGFSIYPNPVKDIISIKSKELKHAEISIYDLTGTFLLSNRISGSLSGINISNLNSGVYFLKVKVGNSEFTKRIIKE